MILEVFPNLNDSMIQFGRLIQAATVPSHNAQEALPASGQLRQAQYCWNRSREHVKTDGILSEKCKTEAPIQSAHVKLIFLHQSLLPEFTPKRCSCPPTQTPQPWLWLTEAGRTVQMSSCWLGTSHLCCGGPRVSHQHRSFDPVVLFLQSWLYWKLSKKPKKEGL